MRRLRCLGWWFAWTLTLQANAQDPLPGVQFSGFGTLGVAGTDSHQVEYAREIFEPTGLTDQPNAKVDSRLGLQWDAVVSDTLRGTVQVVSKYRYDGTFLPTIRIAEVAWNPFSDFQVRAGRMAFELLDFGFNRDVGYSFLWVRPPTEAFFPGYESAIDGAEVTKASALGANATLNLRVWGGRTDGIVPIRQQSQPWNTSGGHDFGGAAELRTGPWRFNLAAARLTLTHEYPAPVGLAQPGLDAFATLLHDPGLAQSGALFPIAGATGAGYSFKVVYQQDPVMAEAFYQRTSFDRFLLPSNETGYTSLGWRIGQATPYLLYSRTLGARPEVPYLGALPSLPSPVAQSLVSGIRTLVTATYANQYTWSAGVRWDFAAQADLKLQVDLVRNPNGPPLLYVLDPSFNGKLTVMSVVLDFLFGEKLP